MFVFSSWKWIALYSDMSWYYTHHLSGRVVNVSHWSFSGWPKK